MTTSNRFLNRLFLAVTGLIVLAVGVFLVLVALPGNVLLSWTKSARGQVATSLRDTPLTGFGATGGSWLTGLLAVLCLVVVIVALVAIFTRGRGRIDRILESDDTSGRIEISSRFAETAIVDALSDRRDVTSVAVTAYRLKKAPALKVRLRVTAGSSPKPVIEAASGVVQGLDRVLGEDKLIPVLLEVVGASAVRPGADSRVV
ncbi:hypothetical protein [Frondihabitans cladoniiphilus]|uniref:Alkaline shock response membrane anchor protein AmaP n=1 Tax=Frondihabitans cladoniiphilus TaxID=715785 RepID=A0ABP8W267_9MICO